MSKKAARNPRTESSSSLVTLMSALSENEGFVEKTIENVGEGEEKTQPDAPFSPPDFPDSDGELEASVFSQLSHLGSIGFIDEGMVREALQSMGFDDRRILGDSGAGNSFYDDSTSSSSIAEGMVHQRQEGTHRKQPAARETKHRRAQRHALHANVRPTSSTSDTSSAMGTEEMFLTDYENETYQHYTHRLAKVRKLLKDWESVLSEEGENVDIARNLSDHEMTARRKRAAEERDEFRTASRSPDSSRHSSRPAKSCRCREKTQGSIHDRLYPRSSSPRWEVYNGGTHRSTPETARSFPTHMNVFKVHPTVPYKCHLAHPPVGHSTTKVQQQWRSSRIQSTSAAEPQVHSPRLGPRVDQQREVGGWRMNKEAVPSTLPPHCITDRVRLAQFYNRLWERGAKKIDLKGRQAVWKTRCSLNPILSY